MKLKLFIFMVMLTTVLVGCSDVSSNDINVLQSALTLNAGDTYQLEYEVFADPGTYVYFQSEDVNVVTVDENGLITAVGGGETVIRVRAGDAYDYVIVRVFGASTTVVSNPTAFVSALAAGEYRIELAADITISDPVIVNAPFEIVFNGYKLRADFDVAEDFDGGLAFYESQYLVDEFAVWDNADTSSLPYLGTIDLGDRSNPIVIYSNHVPIEWVMNEVLYNDVVYTHALQPYSVAMYHDLNGAIPITSMEDMLALATYTPHTFGAGTPYAMTYTSTGEFDDYMITNDIEGETVVDDVIRVAFTDEGYVVLFNDDDTVLSVWEEIQFIANPIFRDAISHPDYNADLSQAAIDAVALEGFTYAYNGLFYQLSLETVSDQVDNISNGTMYGNEYDIENFYFDHEGLIDYAGNFSLINIDFNYIYATNYDGGVAFDRSGGDYINVMDVWFRNVRLDVYDANDESGMLFSNLAAADVMLSNITFYESSIYTDNTSVGFVAGNLDSFHAELTDISVDFSYLNNSNDRENGMMFGTINNSQVTMYSIDVNESKLYTDEDDIGLVAGAVNYSTITILGGYFYNNEVYGDDNIGGLFGDTTFVTITLDLIDIFGLTVEAGDDDTGGIVGEAMDTVMDFREVDIENLFVSGDDSIAGLVGLMSVENVGSTLALNSVDIRTSNISGDNFIGSLVGEANQGYIEAVRVRVHTTSVSATREGAILVGQLDSGTVGSTLILESTMIQYSDINLNTGIGGIIVGESYESLIEIKILETIYNQVLSTSGDIGGLVGTLYHSTLEVNEYEGIFDVLNSTGNVGGLVGNSSNSSIIIYGVHASYEATHDNNYGGLIGYMFLSSLTGYLTYLGTESTTFADPDTYAEVGELFGFTNESYVDLVYGSYSYYSDSFSKNLTEGVFAAVGSLSSMGLYSLTPIRD